MKCVYNWTHWLNEIQINRADKLIRLGHVEWMPDNVVIPASRDAQIENKYDTMYVYSRSSTESPILVKVNYVES